MAENQNQAPALIKPTQEWVYKVAGEEVRLTPSIVRNFLTHGDATITDKEIIAFVSLCKYQQLNPFLNEAYLVKFKNNRGGEDQAQIITSESAYMKRAEACEHYRGFKAGLIIKRGGEIIYPEGEFMLETDTLLGGWCEVARDDREFPMKSYVSLKDYDKGRSTWNQIKCTMIRKVAIVHALREAFPTQLGALYVQSEMPKVEDVNFEDVTKTQGRANQTPLPPEQPAAPSEPESPAAQAGTKQPTAPKEPVQTEIPDAFK